MVLNKCVKRPWLGLQLVCTSNVRWVRYYKLQALMKYLTKLAGMPQRMMKNKRFKLFLFGLGKIVIGCP
jgi:hypothetical protein